MNAKEIVRKAAAAAIATDSENRILGANRSALALLGYPNRDSVRGAGLYALLDLRDMAGNRVAPGHIPFWEMTVRGEPLSSFAATIHKADGSPLQAAFSVVVVLGPEPDRYELVYLLRQILRRRKADEAIERILANPALATVAQEEGTSGAVPAALTPRQTEVLRLLARGLSVGEVAEALHISTHTVRSHVQTILEKLDVHNQAAAVARALRDRLI